ELCILIESYWERMGLAAPVYFSAGLTEKANRFYKLFIGWTNQKVKESFVDRNPFDFKHIKPWSRDYVDLPGPMVLFATPGMLHIGTSLEVFKKWAPDARNMLIMPGYCVAGTIGAKVLAGAKVVDIDQYTQVPVNIDVQNLSFSAHADAKGIMELIRQAAPRNVVLVHGEKSRMSYLKSKIMGEFACPCYDPANGELLEIETGRDVRALMSDQLFRAAWAGEQHRRTDVGPITEMPVKGVLLLGEGKRLTRLLDPSEFDLDDVPVVAAPPPAEQRSEDAELVPEADEQPATVRFSTRKVFDGDASAAQALLKSICQMMPDTPNTLADQQAEPMSVVLGAGVEVSASLGSDDVAVPSLLISWPWSEEVLASRVLSVVNQIL
ncbi:hypothetical protein GGI05_006756, partial [Coemansia sp. RSA 2603]